MAPTIQSNINTERDQRPVRPGEKRSELVCRVKYCNTLPDIPFDPKFITYPFESIRFIQYNPTSLERNYKYEVLTEHDLGVHIDLINKDTYAGDPGAVLDPADEKLLEEDVLTPQDSKRSRHHARSVSWLRRTEYISTEQTRFQPQTMDKVEAKVGYSIKKNFKDETLIMDRDSQIKAIEKTFEDSKKPIEKHYSKPNVVPVEIQPVYPDFKIWKYPCAQVIFDSDPAPTGRSFPAQIEEMSQAMIRGVMDESGEQFVAYFLPTQETLEKRRKDFTNCVEYEDEEEYDYKMAREYNWNVKSKASKGYEENYFLVVREDGVYYNELETRVRLSKRRQKVGQQPNNTRLIVRHRPLKAQEYRMQRYRERQLEPPGEEEEEEEDEEDEEEEEETQEQQQQEDGEETQQDDKTEQREEDGEADGEDSDGEKATEDGETQNGEAAEEDDDQENSGNDSAIASESEKEGSDKDESDKEASDKDGSDKEASERDDSDKEASDREASDREVSDKEESQEENEEEGEEAEGERQETEMEVEGEEEETGTEKEAEEDQEAAASAKEDGRSDSEEEGSASEGSTSSGSNKSQSGSGSGSGSGSDSSSASDSDSGV
ncbi:RNA polymerase II-associated factor 1 homolog [Schistocerca cancellata]|uniref:RNA polymerase II-associated factor 1 homolog n=1 Tax=Schistocerca cancellata TaxID=274614 RepID=UPI0021183E3A|nr:RNA polymerase II-associated factor 1 homolog [Schistocerca cancellata]XP_049778652.1 RNA polymerase II-associated factor 1 homolog [Schistocerca cancellata]